MIAPSPMNCPDVGPEAVVFAGSTARPTRTSSADKGIAIAEITKMAKKPIDTTLQFIIDSSVVTKNKRGSKPLSTTIPGDTSHRYEVLVFHNLLPVFREHEVEERPLIIIRRTVRDHQKCS